MTSIKTTRELSLITVIKLTGLQSGTIPITQESNMLDPSLVRTTTRYLTEPALGKETKDEKSKQKQDPSNLSRHHPVRLPGNSKLRTPYVHRLLIVHRSVTSAVKESLVTDRILPAGRGFERAVRYASPEYSYKK